MLRFEWKKFFSRRYYIVFLLILILFANIIFCYQNSKDQINPKDYKNTQEILKGKTQEQRQKYIQEVKDKNLLFMVKDSVEGKEASLEKFQLTYGKKWINEVIKADYTELLSDSIVKRLEKEEENLQNYDEFLNDVKEQYEINQTISVFNKSDDFILAQNKKTKILYDNMRVEMPASAEGSYGIEKVMSSFLPDIVVIIVICYFFYVLVAFEREKGYLKYNSILKKGENLQLLSKWLALQMLAVLVFALTVILMIIVSAYQYGMADLLKPIQSVVYYVSIPYNINIVSFLLLILLCKTVVYSFLISLLFACYAVVKKYLFSIMITIFVVISFLILSLQIGDNHFFSLFNIVQLLHPEYALKNVIYVRFFSQALPYGVLYITLVASVVLLQSLTLVYFRKEKKLKNYRNNNDKAHKVHSIYFYELKKLWINEYGFSLLIIFIVVQMILIMPIKSMSDLVDTQYNYYVDHIGDKVSREADLKINEKEQEFIEIKEQMKKEKNIFTLSELSRKQRMEQGFIQYKNRYMEIREKNRKQSLIKEDQVRFLIDNEKFQSQLLFAFLVFMNLLVFLCYDREHSSRVNSIQRISKYSNKSLSKVKFISIVIGIISTNLLMNGIMVLHNYSMYPNANYFSSLYDSAVYSNTNFSFSIVGMLVVQVIWQSVVSLSFVYLLQKIYQKISSSKIVVIIFVILFLPLLAKGTSLDALSFLYFLYYPWRNLEIAAFFCLIFISLNTIGFIYERRKKR